ncbi:molybdate ABC transporter permease subunit [Nitriliruptoraceae bacterium ZYF776]|nr:molybdate ABC transporter permease subunit [Profundirhabdus halotolerans]
MLPAVAGVLVTLALTLLLLPTLALLLRTPWSDLVELLRAPVVAPALRLSLLVSLVSLGLSVALGVPLAWGLARARFPGKRLVRALCVLPMVLPPVVGGVGLLAAFGRRGLFGRPLAETFGITLPFSTTAAVLAATFVAMPFLVVTVEAGFRTVDPRYEAAAATLGASRWTVFRRVTLPLLRPSLVAGMALAWARALGEFGATITFAGNLPGRTQTVPLAVYLELERDLDAALALSFVLLAVSVAVLVLLRDRYLGVGGDDPVARRREAGAP